MSIMDEQAVDAALARQLQDDAYAQLMAEDAMKDESENELDHERDDDLEDYHGKISREYRSEDDIEDAAEDDVRDSQLTEDELICIGNAGEGSSTGEQAPPVATRPKAENGRQMGITQYQSDGRLMWLDPTSQKWRSAVFHSQIRVQLIADANELGTYTHPRAAGQGSDVTSYHPDQRDWGFERDQRPDILFQFWAPLNTDCKAEKWITEDGSVVIDLYRNPILRYPNLPDTISSKAEGFLMEAFCRSNRQISVSDIRARMVDDPANPNKRWNGVGKDPIRAGTLSVSMNRFRRRAGCIPWSRKSSEALVKWLEEKVTSSCIMLNSTRGFRDLYTHEIWEMESLEAGTRAPSSGKALAHDVHTKRREKVHRSLEASRSKFDKLHGVEFTDEVEEKSEDQLEEIDDGVEDFRSVVPTTSAHAQLLQHLLQPSRTHYQDFTSLIPSETNSPESYLDQYRKIRADVMEWSLDHDCDDIYPDLVGLRSFTVNGLLWNQNPGTAYYDGRDEWKPLLRAVKTQLEAERHR